MANYRNVIEYLDPEHDIVNTFSPTQQTSFYGPHIEETDYTLKVVMKEDKGVKKSYYILGPGKGHARKGIVDFSRFTLKPVRSGGKDHEMIHYKRGNNDDTEAILYYINHFSACLSRSDLIKEIEIAKMEQEREGMYKIWKAKLANIHYRTMSAIKSATTYLARKAVEFIGMPIFKGIIVGFSVFAMFQTLKLIGQLLAPQTVTVSNPPGVKPMFVMPPAPAVRTQLS